MDRLLEKLLSDFATGGAPALLKAAARRCLALGLAEEAMAHASTGLARWPNDGDFVELLEAASSAPPVPLSTVPSGDRAPLTLVGGGISPGPTPPPARPRPITLADVGGMEAVKEAVRTRFLLPILRPELLAAYARKQGGGLLLYGPPGCGKTFLARAVAGEMRAEFMNVTIADILEMYVGESEKSVQKLFATARAQAPAVMFFDEADGLCKRRSAGGAGETRNVLSQILAEMDGVASRNEGLFFLGATNQPWEVDAALKRPGRFDEVLFVPPPDAVAREFLLRHALADKPREPGLELGGLVARTRGFSGADLGAVVGAAVDLAIKDSLRDGKVVDLNARHLDAAVAKVKPTTASWLELARNYVKYASNKHEFGELAAYLEQNAS